MNTARWIFGFPLAFVISAAILALSVVYDPSTVFYNYLFSSIYHLAVIVFSFALWVFLTCFFIPANKKYATVVPIALSFALAGYSCYGYIKEIQHGFFFPRQLIFSYSCLLIGLSAGFFISYQLFKDKGWGRTKKMEPNDVSVVEPGNHKNP